LASKGKLVIFCILVIIVISTKLLVSLSNYSEIVIIRCFSGLMIRNFLEPINESFKPLMVCSD